MLEFFHLHISFYILMPYITLTLTFSNYNKRPLHKLFCLLPSQSQNDTIRIVLLKAYHNHLLIGYFYRRPASKTINSSRRPCHMHTMIICFTGNRTGGSAPCRSGCGSAGQLAPVGLRFSNVFTASGSEV